VGAAQEALAVGEGLAPGIQAAVDDVHEPAFPVWLGLYDVTPAKRRGPRVQQRDTAHGALTVTRPA